MLYEPHRFNVSKRLPIVFCVDRCSMMDRVTSCGEEEIDIAEDLLCKIFQDIAQDAKMKDSVEICSLTTKMLYKTDFRLVNDCNNSYIEEFDSTSVMLMNGFEKLHKRIKQYEDSEIDYYLPIVIIIGGELFDESECLQYADETANIVIIRIGADIQENILSDVEIFGIPNCSYVNEFDIRFLIRYTRDAYPSNITRDVIIDRFHDGASELRKRISARNKALAEGCMDTQITDDIMGIIQKDMDDLLKSLIDE